MAFEFNYSNSCMDYSSVDYKLQTTNSLLTLNIHTLSKTIHSLSTLVSPLQKAQGKLFDQ